MINVIKLALFSFISIMGLFVTFGIVWQQFGLLLTQNACVLLAVLSATVGIPYVIWMLR